MRFVGGELDVQLGEELGVVILLEVHNGLEQLVDGVEDEHAETTLAIGSLFALPFLFLHNGFEKQDM